MQHLLCGQTTLSTGTVDDSMSWIVVLYELNTCLTKLLGTRDVYLIVLCFCRCDNDAEIRCNAVLRKFYSKHKHLLDNIIMSMCE